jgi:transposase
MNVRYRITLSSEERAQLRALVQGGKGSVRKLKRAQILLAAAGGSGDERIAVNISVGTSTVYRTKRRFVEEGLEQALSEAPRPGAERKLAAKEEALLVATACSKPPAGRARWTLSLLADEMVRLTRHRSLSSETIRRRLAENELKPWQEKMWCIPKVDAEYVARMEDVLDLYAEAPDERRPVVCFDETHGGDRDRRHGLAVPRPPHPRDEHPRFRGSSLGATAKSRQGRHQVALHGGARPRKARPSVSHLRRATGRPRRRMSQVRSSVAGY